MGFARPQELQILEIDSKGIQTLTEAFKYCRSLQ